VSAATNESYLYAYARANPSAAGTYPGNLYLFGGCSTSSAAGCTAYSQVVDKCNIAVTTGAISGCTTTGQQQIGIIPGDTAVGLGIMSGTVYAGYIYLIGGVSPNQQDLKTVRYAKFDNNNNVVSGEWQWHLGRNRQTRWQSVGVVLPLSDTMAIFMWLAATTAPADTEFWQILNLLKSMSSDGSLGTTGSGFNVSSVTINQRWGLSVPISTHLPTL